MFFLHHDSGHINIAQAIFKAFVIVYMYSEPL